MTEPLGHSEFSWVPPESVNILEIPDNSDYGYFIEADFKVPQEKHDFFNDLPFLPIKETPPNSKFPKLMTTLEDKTHYVLHYKTFQQAIKYGLQLQKIHRVLRYRQSQWLKSYIDLNTMFRATATNDFDKNLFKLLNNVSLKKNFLNLICMFNFLYFLVDFRKIFGKSIKQKKDILEKSV